MDAPRTPNAAPRISPPPRLDARELLHRYLRILTQALSGHTCEDAVLRQRLGSRLAHCAGRTFVVVVFDGTPDLVRGTFGVRLDDAGHDFDVEPLHGAAADGSLRSAWYVSETHLLHLVHKPLSVFLEDPERLDLDWLD